MEVVGEGRQREIKIENEFRASGLRFLPLLKIEFWLLAILTKGF